MWQAAHPVPFSLLAADSLGMHPSLNFSFFLLRILFGKFQGQLDLGEKVKLGQDVSSTCSLIIPGSLDRQVRQMVLMELGAYNFKKKGKKEEKQEKEIGEERREEKEN